MKIRDIVIEVYGIDLSKPFPAPSDVMFAEKIINETINWIDSNVGMISEKAKKDLLKHMGVDDE